MTEAQLRQFLSWFKAETEAAWEAWQAQLVVGVKEDTDEHAAIPDWQAGTKWSPMHEDEIAACERRWGVSFPWDYRLFLIELGVPDRPALVESWLSDTHIETREAAYFMDWRGADLEVAEKLTWPVMGLFGEGERPWWWDDSWGAWASQPGGAQKVSRWQEARNVLKVVRAAPQLIPFYSHRFIYSRQGEESVVLSVMGADIIVYAMDLRLALLADFSSLLPEAQPYFESATYESLGVADFPFWGRIIG